MILTAPNKKQMARVFAEMQVAEFDSAVSEGCRCYFDSTNGRRGGEEDINLMFTLPKYIYLNQSDWGKCHYMVLSSTKDLQEM